MAKIRIDCNREEAGIVEIKDYSGENLEELLYENEEEILSILEEKWSYELQKAPYYQDVIPQGIYNEEDYYVDYKEAARNFVQGHKAEAHLIIDECEESRVNYVDLSKFVSELVRRECGDCDERADQVCGWNLVRSLEKFLCSGKWHVGLRNNNENVIEDSTLWPEPILVDGNIVWQSGDDNELEPIIWFGLDNELPIECWTLTPQCNYLTALSYGEDFPYYDWLSLTGELSNVVFWAFEEGGEYGPDPQQLIDACPIQLHVGNVAEYVMSYQKENRGAKQQSDL